MLAFRSRQSGFTMIELLVVTTIIIVLSTVGLVSYQQATMRARNSKRQADLEMVRQALVLYRTDTGAYPTTAQFDWGTMSPIQEYIGVTELNDPKDAAPYTYTYTGTTTSFSLCYTLEPDADQNCLANP